MVYQTEEKLRYTILKFYLNSLFQKTILFQRSLILRLNHFSRKLKFIRPTKEW